MERSHEAVLDEAPAYLMGELAGAERAAVEAHLAACAACRAEFERLREAMETLAADIPAVAPPPRLRQAVLAAVRREPPRAPAAPGTPVARTPDAAGVPAAPVHALSEGRPAAPATRRPAAALIARWWPTVVAAAAAVALAVQAGQAGARLRTSREAYAALARRNEVLTGRLARAEADLHVAVLQLAATSTASRGAVASLAVAQGATRAEVVVVARGLPPPRGSEVYQLWYLNGGKATSGGVLTYRAGGGGTATLRGRLPAPLVVKAAAISREPRPGDAQPQGPIVLAGA